jgi:hypothetical protein
MVVFIYNGKGIGGKKTKNSDKDKASQSKEKKIIKNHSALKLSVD